MDAFLIKEVLPYAGRHCRKEKCREDIWRAFYVLTESWGYAWRGLQNLKKEIGKEDNSLLSLFREPRVKEFYCILVSMICERAEKEQLVRYTYERVLSMGRSSFSSYLCVLLYVGLREIRKSRMESGTAEKIGIGDMEKQLWLCVPAKYREKMEPVFPKIQKEREIVENFNKMLKEMDKDVEGMELKVSHDIIFPLQQKLERLPNVGIYRLFKELDKKEIAVILMCMPLPLRKRMYRYAYGTPGMKQIRIYQTVAEQRPTEREIQEIIRNVMSVLVEMA